ncbi:MAG: hypothetical protein K2Q26_04225 [Bdellovibrionales bacterium]|nr:hypothetical protein [Bdellovibrionales bacterium]
MKFILFVFYIISPIVFAQMPGTSGVSFFHRGNMKCPTGFVGVPGNVNLGSRDFCVMQFEAKNDGSGNAISQAASPPWTNISATTAFSRCSAISEAGFTGTFALMSNAEWMTIARDAEHVSVNWTGGSPGSGLLFRGNGSGNGVEIYDGANPESGTGRNARARLTLSNGSVIWDLAGNVWEFLDWSSADGVLTVGPTTCNTGVWNDLTVTCPAFAANQWGPEGSWTNAQGTGQWYGDSGGVLRRGGSFNFWSGNGIYSLGLSANASTTAADSGFRCVYRP